VQHGNLIAEYGSSYQIAVLQTNWPETRLVCGTGQPGSGIVFTREIP